MFDWPAATNTSPTYTFVSSVTTLPSYFTCNEYGLRLAFCAFNVQVNEPFFAIFAVALAVILPWASVADSFDASICLLACANLTVPLTTNG